MSHPCHTPNPVTSTKIGSPVPSTQIPHHLIIPQPSDGWYKLHKTRLFAHTHQRGPSASLDVGGGFDFTSSSMKGLRLSRIVVFQMTLVDPAAQYRGCGCVCVTGTPWPNDVLF
ncbi:hypothetical protein O181_075503 [Austropuccinia psidii MF-1]|uniref:Uncharacterized protein n=1 Tax=Austropuccinia psidii MF-1 TaxID=1389203 RepID=A0A9Q3F911_9BASI|nr:hypothetical protein [Austropuccinia psidii MF-1]